MTDQDGRLALAMDKGDVALLDRGTEPGTTRYIAFGTGPTPFHSVGLRKFDTGTVAIIASKTAAIVGWTTPGDGHPTGPLAYTVFAEQMANQVMENYNANRENFPPDATQAYVIYTSKYDGVIVAPEQSQIVLNTLRDMASELRILSAKYICRPLDQMPERGSNGTLWVNGDATDKILVYLEDWKIDDYLAPDAAEVMARKPDTGPPVSYFGDRY